MERWEDRVGLRLKLRDLHILIGLEQSGSMAKAAKLLGVSQPAISKAIADLEHTVGVRLVDRGPRGVEPTPYGRALIRRGLATFDEMRQAVGDIRFLADPTVGELRVGISEAVADAFLPAVLKQFKREAPGVTVKLLSANMSTTEFRELRERQVELFLGWVLGSYVEDEIATEFLFEDPIVVATGIGSRWARKRKLKPTDLADANWIISPPTTDLGPRVAAALRRLGVELPKGSIETGWFSFRSILLDTGDYVSAIPLSMADGLNTNLARIKILPVNLDVRARPTTLVTLKHRTLGAPAQRFIDSVRIAAKAMAKRASDFIAATSLAGIDERSPPS